MASHHTNSFLVSEFLSLDSSGDSNIFSIDSLANGSMAFCGRFNGSFSWDGQTISSVGGEDIVLGGWTEENGWWITTFGGDQDDDCWKVIYQSTGEILLTGKLRGSGSIDGNSFVAGGSGDGVIIRLTTKGSNITVDDWTIFGGSGWRFFDQLFLFRMEVL